MHAQTFLHNFLSKSLSFIHKTRLKLLLNTVGSLLQGGQLTLASLGRNMSGLAKVKNKIKAVDRLLGNTLLQQNKFEIYQKLGTTLLASAKEATILIDYSGCCSQEHWIIRASLAAEGRSIVLYQEVHPLKRYDNERIKKSFLKKLKMIIPQKIKVIIVTDAAFRTPWFRLVHSFGWDFIGRARGIVKLQLEGQSRWTPVKKFYKHASNKARKLGKALLSINQKFPVFVYSYKAKLHGRKVKRQKCRHLYPGKQEQYSKLSREPWILISSLDILAKKIVKLYKKRMQVEQNFRDDKSERYGFAWRYSRTKDPLRYTLLLLIAYIAALVLWLIGRAAEAKGLHRDFQANTSKKRTLSYVTLGKQVLKHAIDKIQGKEILEAIHDIGILQSAY